MVARTMVDGISGKPGVVALRAFDISSLPDISLSFSYFVVWWYTWRCDRPPFYRLFVIGFFFKRDFFVIFLPMDNIKDKTLWFSPPIWRAVHVNICL